MSYGFSELSGGAPLAELHLHLEGSLEAATLIELDPALTPDAVAERYRYTGFLSFLDAYKWVVRRLNRPEEYALAARHLFARLAAQGIRHADLNLSVGVMLRRSLDAAAIIRAVRAEAGCQTVSIEFVFDAVRQFGPEQGLAVAELAREFGAAFGVGGDETGAPLTDFAPAAERSGGVFIPHAGETSTPRDVWDALEMGARRIGHGIRAVQDEVLCRRLREDGIVLEISLSSNAATGSVPSLPDHPVRELLDRGVPLTLNTDDPAMFRTTLAREFQLARDLFRFTGHEVAHVQDLAWQYRLGGPRLSAGKHSIGEGRGTG
jgi:adenosine deaminase/aminodeoxyfutalosine deaminase